MKPDEHDIICEQDYSPLSNAELVEAIERYAAIMHTAPLVDFDLEWITGPARALLARAEAAEAEAARLRDGLAAMSERVTLAQRSASLAENALGTARSRWEEAERREKSIFDSAMGLADQRDSLAARVAELEAQLAAQQWRPVTEKPEKPGWYVVYDSDGHVFYNAEIFPYRVARWTGKWDSAFNGLVDYWRPLPPAPQEAE